MEPHIEALYAQAPRFDEGAEVLEERYRAAKREAAMPFISNASSES